MSPDELDPLANIATWFIFCLVLFHLTLVWPRNRTRRQWKYVDYVWLSIGLLGLVSLGGDIRRDRAKFAEELAETRVRTMHELFLNLYVEDPPSSFCMQFYRSPSSPVDLAATQVEYDKACEWWRSFSSGFAEVTLPGYRVVRLEQFDPPDFDNVLLVKALEDLEEQLGFYIAATEELSDIREAQRQNWVEALLFDLWPYLLGCMVALRIAKTSGELRLKNS